MSETEWVGVCEEIENHKQHTVLHAAAPMYELSPYSAQTASVLQFLYAAFVCGNGRWGMAHMPATNWCNPHMTDKRNTETMHDSASIARTQYNASEDALRRSCNQVSVFLLLYLCYMLIMYCVVKWLCKLINLWSCSATRQCQALHVTPSNCAHIYFKRAVYVEILHTYLLV